MVEAINVKNAKLQSSFLAEINDPKKINENKNWNGNWKIVQKGPWP